MNVPTWAFHPLGWGRHLGGFSLPSLYHSKIVPVK